MEAQARPDRSAVGVARSVFVELSSPLRRKKGRTVIDLLANFTTIR